MASLSRRELEEQVDVLREHNDGEEFAAAAERAGVLVSAAETFVVSRTHAPHAARLCLGTPRTRAEVETALARLSQLLEGVPAPARALV